jgi:hypothetical protein
MKSIEKDGGAEWCNCADFFQVRLHHLSRAHELLLRSQPRLSRREPKSAALAGERKLFAGAPRLSGWSRKSIAHLPGSRNKEVFIFIRDRPCTVILERQPARLRSNGKSMQ